MLDLAIYMNYDFIPENPSVRLRRLNLRKPLRNVGVNADIIQRFEDLAPFKNILLSNVNQQTYEEARLLKLQGKKLYFCHSENLWNLPFQNEIFNLCDYIVCCSKKLAELTQPRLTSLFTKCVVIEDMAEPSNATHIPKETDRLKVVWTGMGGNSYLARNLRDVIESVGMELVVISEHADADLKWNLETYLYDMAKFDIAICPQNTVVQPAKSAVKVITAMSVGLPVVASPNPAYLEVIKDGENGFIAETKEEWRDALQKLKDLNTREKFSRAALVTANDFTPYEIAHKWLNLLSKKNKKTVALINNTLRQKYLSYGDIILDQLRLDNYDVEEFRYEDIDCLPEGKDYYLFVEVRYNPERISNLSPLILYTREAQNLNNLPHFDFILTNNPTEVKKLNARGFVNTLLCETASIGKMIKNLENYDLDSARIRHNEELHSRHINSFYCLQPPEVRWEGFRDKLHLDFSMKNSVEGDSVLDVGSADGFLSIYVARFHRNVSALDFVDRGIDWTKQQAARFGVNIDIRKGAIESLQKIFSDKKFNSIFLYEILEHLDYRRLEFYLQQAEDLLFPKGKILISLPSQNCELNLEHKWTPTEFLIKKTFGTKKNLSIEWKEFPEGEIPGNWFISYEKK